MLNSSELKALDDYLRTLPHDPVFDLLLEALFVPQLSSDSPRILSSLECAVLAGSFIALDFPVQHILQILDYVTPEVVHRLRLKARMTLLNYLLSQQCWEPLGRYVDTTRVPQDWFNDYAYQRLVYIEEQIDHARTMIEKGINVTFIVMRLQTLDPDNVEIALLEGESLLAEKHGKKAQRIFLNLILHPQVSSRARSYLDYLRPGSDFATTSDGY